jgi:hypothetical protein
MADWTQVMQGNLIKTIAWYDNEWGYSCRTAEITWLVARLGLTQGSSGGVPARDRGGVRRTRSLVPDRITPCRSRRSATWTSRPESPVRVDFNVP